MNINEGISAIAKQLYQEILTRGTVNDKVDKKKVRIAITEEKLSMLKSDQTECLQILDILDIITKHCLTDHSIRFDDNASELTCYRKFAKVLDKILDNTMLDILDGERVFNKASKTVVKNLEKIYNNKVMTVSMDWTGTIGYMFAVKPLNDVFVTRTLYTLTIPIYIDELPSFIDTLDHLYSWRNYHALIKDIVLEAFSKREKERFFYSSMLGSSTTATTGGSTSPNVYLTPT
ncbi:hypothetical protein BDC45DRAFT_535674 [Circinella umbellata]|nr:hypothetical protein BDC45DRAFT_535674 [Circinella umbellata]